MKKSRLKKGQLLRFRKGELAKVCSQKSEEQKDIVALWSTRPSYISERGMMEWQGSMAISSHVKQTDLLLVVAVHNFAFPQNRQYCKVVCCTTSETGWVSSEFLEKI